MRQLILSITLLLSFTALSQETMNYRKYTIGEVYEMIAKEKSDTFTLKNANIITDTLADRDYLLKVLDLETMVPTRDDSIEIHKSLVFENVFMSGVDLAEKYAMAFNKVIFHKPVSIKNSWLWFTHSHFRSTVVARYDDGLSQSTFENLGEEGYVMLLFDEIIFEFDPRISSQTAKKEPLNVSLWLKSSILKGTKEIRDINWFLTDFSYINIEDNTFLNRHASYMALTGSRGLIINNDFGDRSVQVYITNQRTTSTIEFSENKFHKIFMLTIPESIQNFQMDWAQFSAGILNMSPYSDFIQGLSKSNSSDDYDLSFRDHENINKYLDSARVVNNRFYKAEIALLGTLNSIYKRQHDLESANASYIALKDLETKRLGYLFEQERSFDSYFKWKINQFLKLFSAYGTEPAKAITMSVYVVLVFAFIYLFFPNYWDSHGKNRIVDRYSFFLKYMKRDAGMQDVYLEEKRAELMAYDDYKQLIESSGKDVPKFFQATALPLYKWAISGTKVSAVFLSKVDVMKGTWSELPQSKRVWKSFLLVSAFLVALLYDIFIKVLNALMLSINTFTTLGFGEIPIKGLPRYLAIIQGFIGWFMLTIFSVSLISQLLN